MFSKPKKNYKGKCEEIGNNFGKIDVNQPASRLTHIPPKKSRAELSAVINCKVYFFSAIPSVHFSIHLHHFKSLSRAKCNINLIITLILIE